MRLFAFVCAFTAITVGRVFCLDGGENVTEVRTCEHATPEDDEAETVEPYYGSRRLSVGKTLTHSKEEHAADPWATSRGSPEIGDVGKPLYLTEYIETGKLEEGRRKAEVVPFVDGHPIKSFSGFMTVNKRFDSNLFFWYFESEKDPEHAPLLVWLQGGPGGSSLYGLFVENGPYIIRKHSIARRDVNWCQDFNVIFIDNPVGTGFSFTRDGYAKNETVVGEDLYSFIVQFLTLFPNLQSNKFYLTGESYAGKYVPAFAHRIHVENRREENKLKVNLKGVFIGDGWTDPINMLHYGSYLYQLGLIDDNAKKQFRKLERITRSKIRHERWGEAEELFNNIINTEKSLYYNLTGLESYYNYYNVRSGSWHHYQDRFVNSSFFRSAVHVGDLPYHEGGVVYENLREDIMKSVIHLVVELLDHYSVVFYNGQVDVICAYPLTENVLKKMRWKHSRQYRSAANNIYKVNGEVAGYYKAVGNLMEILIRDAGHMVPTDQPKWALQMLKDVIFETGNLS